MKFDQAAQEPFKLSYYVGETTRMHQESTLTWIWVVELEIHKQD